MATGWKQKRMRREKVIRIVKAVAKKYGLRTLHNPSDYPDLSAIDVVKHWWSIFGIGLISIRYNGSKITVHDEMFNDVAEEIDEQLRKEL